MSANQHLDFLPNQFFQRVKADDFSQEEGKTFKGWVGLGSCLEYLQETL
jgi:hypothetical protein